MRPLPTAVLEPAELAALLMQLQSFLARPPEGDLDFFPSTSNEIVFQDGNLGIPAQVVLPLFNHGWREFQRRRSDGASGAGPDSVLLMHALCVLNPDCYTLWNAKKAFILRSGCDAALEVGFCFFLLTKHPSKARIWDHLAWLETTGVVCFGASGRVSSRAHRVDTQRTRLVCTRAADRYKCNYPCWSFCRRFLAASGHDELQRSQAFCASHISDSSGFSYRQHLLWTLVQAPDQPHDWPLLFAAELEWIQQLIAFFPPHECLWMHLFFVVLCVPEYAPVARQLARQQLDGVPQSDTTTHSSGVVDRFLDRLDRLPGWPCPKTAPRTIPNNIDAQ
ncbi:hypothetical protein HDU91_006474 [Kappamyces sp. JEL0680]|nr:hypothetical protein HDU91_006474 [Kappamyces sp. JEL0680]